MKRHIGDKTEQFVEWTPEEMLVICLFFICEEKKQLVSSLCFGCYFSCPGEWVKGSEIKMKPKHIPITELNAAQLNRLLPPIYAYRTRRRGQRKRSIISTLSNTS